MSNAGCASDRIAMEDYAMFLAGIIVGVLVSCGVIYAIGGF